MEINTEKGMTFRTSYDSTLLMHEQKKKDHIELTAKAQIKKYENDKRFNYEPLLSAHPTKEFDISSTFLGKTIKAPFFVSSMTGGHGKAREINQNLALLCREFSLGMGLGSCRPLLENDRYFADFNLREILGNELPFFANLGVAQLEKFIENKNTSKIFDLMESLRVDGLIIHVNPLQEWFQVEGDRFKERPIETISKFCELNSNKKYKLIVKEVGQGMGPKSLDALLNLKIDAIELAGFGGTNFSKLEMLRNEKGINTEYEALVKLGHTPLEMIKILNELLEKNPTYGQKQIIISGGVENFLDGFYLRESLNFSSVIGQARNYIKVAKNYSELKKIMQEQIEGMKMAKSFLEIKNKQYFFDTEA